MTTFNESRYNQNNKSKETIEKNLNIKYRFNYYRKQKRTIEL